MHSSQTRSAPDDSAQTDGQIVTAVSENPDPRSAAREIWQQLQPDDPACVIFFSGSDYELGTLASAIEEFFGDVPVVGCTTAGEISKRGFTTNSITAFTLPRSHFAVEILLLNNLATFSAEQARSAAAAKLQELTAKALAPIEGHSFVLSLLDGMSIREELILQALNEALGSIPLLGGSAGDNLHFRDTFIYSNARFHGNSAALILVNTLCPFEVISSHHMASDNEKLVVTDADPVNRIAREFNAEPAALEYCRVMGLKLDELDARAFAAHPLAVQVGEQLFIRSIQQLNDDLSLTFFCAIDTGVVLTSTRDTGMIEHFQTLMAEVSADIGEPQLVIGCDCIHRRIEAEEKNLLEPLAAIYQGMNVVGFSTYGEQRNGLHTNHSFTGVVIGNPETELHD